MFKRKYKGPKIYRQHDGLYVLARDRMIYVESIGEARQVVKELKEMEKCEQK